MKRAVVGLAVAVALLAASAASGASAGTIHYRPTGTCPPGSSVGAYCEQCTVPVLTGDTIKQATAALEAADCKVGLLIPARAPAGTKFLSVVFSVPPAGSVKPAGSRVSLGVAVFIG
jgi:hypothetical protein